MEEKIKYNKLLDCTRTAMNMVYYFAGRENRGLSDYEIQEVGYYRDCMRRYSIYLKILNG